DDAGAREGVSDALAADRVGRTGGVADQQHTFPVAAIRVELDPQRRAEQRRLKLKVAEAGGGLGLELLHEAAVDLTDVHRRPDARASPVADSDVRRMGLDWEDPAISGDATVLEFEDRCIPGYGWVFPIEPHSANIGVGYWRSPGIRSPMHIREVHGSFVQQLQSKAATRFGDLELQSPLFGSPLGVQFNADRCDGEGVLLVGDAARTTDPISGEGIAYALAGARIVADIAMRRQ